MCPLLVQNKNMVNPIRVNLSPLSDKITTGIFLFTLLIFLSCLLAIPLFVFNEGALSFADKIPFFSFIIEDPWRPFNIPPLFGILHAWVATVYMTALCLIFAAPFGYGFGLFFAEVAPPILRKIIRPIVNLLAGIPAVVYGFFGFVTVVPGIEYLFDLPVGETLLAASLILALMTLPFIAGVSAEALSAVPFELKEAAYSQGVSRWYVIRRISVPYAIPGLFAAGILGLARAIGETIAVLMLVGNSIILPTSALDRGQPLTSLITTELGEAGFGSDKYQALFGAGLLLMIVVLTINSITWWLKKRMMSYAR